MPTLARYAKSGKAIIGTIGEQISFRIVARPAFASKFLMR